jgi:hypothetical protein
MTRPSPSPTTASFARSLLIALGLGASSSLAALGALSCLSPASDIAPATLSAIEAIANGQSSLMAKAFAQEIRTEISSEAFALGPGGARMRLLYAQEGKALSFARLPSRPSKPCSIELEIDGAGQPAMAGTAFLHFNGRIEGAYEGLTAARAAGAAFTVAHEMGHCELSAMPWSKVELALFHLADQEGASLDAKDRSDISEFLTSSFGFGLIHEGYADAKAAQAMARRMSKSDFESLMGMALAHRSATTRLFTQQARIAQDNALHSATSGVPAFLFAHPEAAAAAGLESTSAIKLAKAGASLCSKPASFGVLALACDRL